MKWLVLGMGMLSVWCCQAQGLPHGVLRGKVVDETTGEPLPFAGIGNRGNTIGTATNGKGEFSLKLPRQADADTLTFSYLGYMPRRIPLAELNANPLVVKLKAAAVPLDEVVVTAYFSAADTLRKAIGLIPRNYPDVPVLLGGFYRETLREDQTDGYRLYAEGVLECYKSSYAHPAGEDEVRVVKGRKKKLPYGGLPPIINGPRVAVILDILKSREFFTHPGRFDSYQYRFEKVVFLNGQPAYVIAFGPKGDYQARAYFSGRVYVQSADLAFVRAEYELARPGLATVNQGGLPLQVASRRYTVSYTPYQGKWCLQNGRILNQFRHSATGSSLTSDIVFTVTYRRSDNVTRFRRRERVNDEQTFTEEVRAFDDAYWQDYTIIEEESPGGNE